MLRSVGFRDVRMVSQWFAEDVSLSRMNAAPVRGHVTVHAAK
jgi:hypothetical protein